LNTAFAREPVNLSETLTNYANAVEMIHGHLIMRVAFRTRRGVALAAALDTIPALCSEAQHLRTMFALARLDHVNLVAAARATVRADRDGERDPLWYLRDELAARGQFPVNPKGRG